MSTALATTQQTVALARPLEFTPDQYKMIRDTYANGASDSEFAVLMEVAKARNLNPLLRQIWFIKRWDDGKKCEVWAVQTSIDGLRTIAQRSGLYDGQDEPVFEPTQDGKSILRCKVSVYRKDWGRPAVGVAYWSEYAARKRDGGLTRMWAEKPHIMLSKCAEALALRKAFPEDTAGLYVPEEMGPAVDDGEPKQQPPKQQPQRARSAPAPVRAVPVPRVESGSAAPALPVAHKPPPVEDAVVVAAPSKEVQPPAEKQPSAKVVESAPTSAGNVVRIQDVEDPAPAKPEPTVVREPGADDAEPSACEELLGLLGTITSKEWLQRKNAAQSKGLLTREDYETLRKAWEQAKNGGK